MTMVSTPVQFLKVEEKVVGTDSTQFSEAQFGEAPEAFDAIDVIFAARELILMMMNAVMLVATQDEAVIGLKAVGINGGLGKHLPLDDRHQCLLGAVFDDLGECYSNWLPGRRSRVTSTPFWRVEIQVNRNTD